jgi:pantothenate kinase-related protein Tda10
VTRANDGGIEPEMRGLRGLAGRHDADVGQMEFRPLVRGFRRFDVHLFDQSVSDAIGMLDDGVKDQLALQVVDSLVDMDD